MNHDSASEGGRSGGGLLATVLVSVIVSAFVAALVAGTVIVLFQLDEMVTPAVEDHLAEWAGDPAVAVTRAAPDEAISGTFRGDETRHLYAFELPADAIHARVELDGGDVDVDLDIAFSAEAAHGEDWLDSSHSTSGQETLVTSRSTGVGFGSDALMVHVSRYETHAEEADYTLTVHITVHVLEQRLAPGDVLQASLGPDTAHRRAYRLVLPAGVDLVRLDLADVRQDLDLAVHPGPLYDVATAAAAAETQLARETLLVSRRELRLDRGEQTLEVLVADAAETDREIPFTLYVTEGPDAPEAIHAFPDPPQVTSARERIVAGIVSLIAHDNEGSGVVVGSDGLILTAAHVVETVETGADDVVIALTLDPTEAPYELLRGRVTHRDEERDIALVQVTSTFTGHELPEGWPLPAVKIRWEPHRTLGETLHAVGFPMLHAGGDRSEVTWTTGVLSGFERHDGHLTLRFDAEIAGGSSGGAVLDDELRLIGVVTSAHGGTSSFTATGVALPPESFPDGWAELLR